MEWSPGCVGDGVVEVAYCVLVEGGADWVTWSESLCCGYGVSGGWVAVAVLMPLMVLWAGVSIWKLARQV